MIQNMRINEIEDHLKTAIDSIVINQPEIIEKLTDKWIPDEIIGRDDEIKKIIEFIAQISCGKRQHLIINGLRGMGKTLVSRSFAEAKIVRNVNLIRIDCQSTSPKQIPKIIATALELPNCSTFLDILDRVKKPVILFIDHIEHISNHHYFAGAFDRLFINPFFHFIFITSNLRKLNSYISKNGRYTPIMKITFRTYHVESVRQIIKQRLNLIPTSFGLSDHLIDLIADHTINGGGGDIKFLLNILSDLIKISQKKQAMPTEDDVITTIATIQRIVMGKTTMNITDPHVLTLLEILMKIAQSNTTITRYDLYGVFMNYVTSKHLPVKSDTWLHRWLHILQNVGITKLFNKTRKGIRGKTSIVQIVATVEQLQNYILNIEQGDDT